MGDLYDRTIKAAARLREQGYIVIEQWSCQWHEQLRKDAELQATVKALKIPDPLHPRDALQGVFDC